MERGGGGWGEWGVGGGAVGGYELGACEPS
jgi:hypothetical protein